MRHSNTSNRNFNFIDNFPVAVKKSVINHRLFHAVTEGIELFRFEIYFWMSWNCMIQLPIKIIMTNTFNVETWFFVFKSNTKW